MKRIGRFSSTASLERSTRGAALIMAVMVIASLMVLSAAIVRIVGSHSRQVNASVDDRLARELAEAGVHEAMTAIASGWSGNVATLDVPAYQGQGVFWVEAVPIAGDQIRLVSTALVGSGRVALEVTVEGNSNDSPLFRTTLNSKDQLTMNADVMVDSYDSSVGSYASQAISVTDGLVHANVNGHVASNEDIILNANAHVFGDATPGPGHSVTFNMGSYVSGSTAPSASEFSFPPIVVPPIASSGDYSVGVGGWGVIPSGNHAFGSLSIGKEGTLQIQGPATIVVQDFSGGKDATLNIDAYGGPVSIYVQDSYSHFMGFQAAPVAGSPMAVAFFIEGSDAITFPSHSQIRGAYYAPEAAITFTSHNEVWGAFAAKQITMSSSMNFHFDEHLMEHWEEDTGQSGAGVEVLAWFDTEVSPAFLQSNRKDPFHLLDLDKTALPRPADAWWDPAP